ncbi:MAG: hypothetical protein ACU0DK_00115 [Pseudooceanicola sp.]
MSDTDREPRFDDSYEITLIGVEDGKHYFVYRGEKHLNQLMLVDGDFPQPVQCLNFRTQFDAQLALGETINMVQYWSIHPEIVARLRDTDVLVEPDV